MSEIVKKFNFEKFHITAVKEGDNIWFKAKEVAMALGYKDSDDAVRKHVKQNEKK